MTDFIIMIGLWSLGIILFVALKEISYWMRNRMNNK